MPRKPRKHRQRSHHFIAAWVKSPLKIGAFVPSSRWLARAMATQVNGEREGIVIELGAGTGVVTNALLMEGIDPAKLLIVERDPRLHAILQSHFHDLSIVCADAAHLDDMLKEQKASRVNAIVSSLPLLSMPKMIRDAIATQMLKLLAHDNAILVQFTYGPRSPLPRDLMRRHHIVGRRIKTIIANVPPAHVWVYRKERRARPRH